MSLGEMVRGRLSSATSKWELVYYRGVRSRESSSLPLATTCRSSGCRTPRNPELWSQRWSRPCLPPSCSVSSTEQKRRAPEGKRCFPSGEKRRSNLVRQNNSIATDSIEVADARRVQTRHFLDYPFNRLAFLIHRILEVGTVGFPGILAYP